MAPSTYCGMPQLPLATSTTSGPMASARLWMQATTSEAPTPQLVPQATRRGDRVCSIPAKSLGEIPIMVRPLVSKLRVQTMGKPTVAAPATAASTSSRDDMVSIHSTSTPPALRLRACSANASRAFSKVRVPMGSMISPVGPMLPATAMVRPEASATSRAKRAAAWFSSSTRFWALCSLRR